MPPSPRASPRAPQPADPGAELRALMAQLARPDPSALRPASVANFALSLDAVVSNLRSTHARLEARVATNAAREADLSTRESDLAAEEAALHAAATRATARRAAADALLDKSTATLGTIARGALAASASATYNFEEQYGNLVRATQARERGFSASVALDVTNTRPRAGVSEWSARVAAGGGMKTSLSPREPPASPMRRSALLAASPPLKNRFGIV